MHHVLSWWMVEEFHSIIDYKCCWAVVLFAWMTQSFCHVEWHSSFCHIEWHSHSVTLSDAVILSHWVVYHSMLIAYTVLCPVGTDASVHVCVHAHAPTLHFKVNWSPVLLIWDHVQVATVDMLWHTLASVVAMTIRGLQNTSCMKPSGLVGFLHADLYIFTHTVQC